MVKQVPFSSSLLNCTWPCISSTYFATMCKPSPVPGILVALDFALKKRSNKVFLVFSRNANTLVLDVECDMFIRHVYRKP